MTRSNVVAWAGTVTVALVLAPAAASAQVARGLQPDIPATWTKYVPPSQVTGVDGQTYTPSCSGFPGTDPTFSFWAKRGKLNNLVIFFEGGGACWDSLTCSFPIGTGLPAQFFVPQVPPGINPAAFAGIFELANRDNPVKDWSFVYIPYCTGDVHLGSVQRQYFNAGNPLLGQLTSFPIRHRGFDNFMAVLAWVTDTFRAPQSILVAGSSAGAYGAMGNFPWIAEAYPNAHHYVVGDAGQGVNTPAFDTGQPGRNSWNPQLAPWVFGGDVNAIDGIDIARIVAAAYPRAKFSQFTTYLDTTQIGFYSVMKQAYGPGGSCSNAAMDWNQQMLAGLDQTQDEGNFRSYLAAGTYHTILRSPQVYTEASAGIRFSTWLDRMLKNMGGTNGQGGQWFNAACPGCTMPLPCQ